MAMLLFLNLYLSQKMFHMLKRMHKSIVCEGVETEVIADFLKNEGCNEIQGFLYFLSMCIGDFETFIHMQKGKKLEFLKENGQKNLSVKYMKKKIKFF